MERHSKSSAGPVPVQFRPANRGDDRELRRLLRDNPVPGSFSLAMEREPDFFVGAGIEGDVSQTVVAQAEGDNGLCGLGSRAVRDAYVNGEMVRLGYFGQLRVDRVARGKRGILEGGFQALRELHDADDTPFYVTTIIEGAEAARRALTSGREGMPTYREHEVMCTLALPLRRFVRTPQYSGFIVRRALLEDMDAVSACLQSSYARLQFAPSWTAADLLDPERTPGLSPADFVIATRGDRVIGCVATWDQSGFKQTVVHGYSGLLRYARPLVNLSAPITGLPHLPAAGDPLPHAYLSHVAVEDNDCDVLRAVLARAFNDAVGRDWSYLTLAFAKRNPLLQTVKASFRHMEYRSVIYTVFWEDGREAVEYLDDRIPHLELAVL